MNRERLVRELAPVAPNCFSSRGQWLEYVGHAAIYQRDEHAPGPLLFVRGEPVRFNPDFDICSDCDDRYAKDMQRQGRCRPDYLRNLLTPQAKAAA